MKWMFAALQTTRQGRGAGNARAVSHLNEGTQRQTAESEVREVWRIGPGRASPRAEVYQRLRTRLREARFACSRRESPGDQPTGLSSRKPLPLPASTSFKSAAMACP